MKTVIKAQRIGKSYVLGGADKRHETFRDMLSSSLTAPIRRIRRLGGNRDDNKEIIWALQDINLNVLPGEVVGIIGSNGAGKTTLLKILTRITSPTKGRITIRGRVSSLLEVGSGFHPELTGRENIFLNGAILGMTRSEIIMRFDAIVEFAEIAKFLDTPVKRYSSGMYVRLAFAVAAHLQSEILLIDEILAVGDLDFQQRCLGKMNEVATSGRTVLFVSHNLAAIDRLCSRAILLDEGRVVTDGETRNTITTYHNRRITKKPVWERIDRRLSEKVTISYIAATDDNESETAMFQGDQNINIAVKYEIYERLSDCQIGLRVYGTDGIVILTTSDCDEEFKPSQSRDAGTYEAKVKIPSRFLAPGIYGLFVAAHSPRREVYDSVDAPIYIEVGAIGSLASLDDRKGVVAPLMEWTTTKHPRQ